MLKLDRQSWNIIIIVSTAIFICNLDASAVNIALPALSRIFKVTTSSVSRIALMDLLALTSFVMIFGSLSDIKGVDRIFKWGFVTTTFSSLLCALAPDIHILTLFRFIHGVGEAMLLSTYGAIIVQFVPAGARGRAFSLTSVIGGIALAAGSPLGGFLVKHNWRWIFLLNIIPGILGFFLVNKYLQDKMADEKIKSQTFDFIGAIFSFFSLFTLLYALNMGQEKGWFSLLTVSCFVLSVIFTIFFIYWERKQESPLINFSIFKNLSFTFALFGDFVILMTLEGCIFLFPFYFDFIHQFTPAKAGFFMMIYPVLSTLLSPVAGILADKKSPKIICITAMVFIIIACIMFSMLNQSPSIIFIIISLMIFGASVTFFFTSNTCFEMSQVSPKEEGITSAIISFTSNLASVVGICVFETIYSFHFPYHILGKTHIDLHENMHMTGFRHACVFAVIICTAGLVSYLFTKEKPASHKIKSQE